MVMGHMVRAFGLQEMEDMTARVENCIPSVVRQIPLRMFPGPRSAREASHGLYVTFPGIHTARNISSTNYVASLQSTDLTPLARLTPWAGHDSGDNNYAHDDITSTSHSPPLTAILFQGVSLPIHNVRHIIRRA